MVNKLTYEIYTIKPKRRGVFAWILALLQKRGSLITTGSSKQT